MWNWIRKFLHHLFDPHCKECNRCKSCEALIIQLEIANQEKRELLQQMLSLVKPVVVPTEIKAGDPVKRFTPFHIRQRILEEQSRAEAKAVREQDKRFEVINSIEKELGINNGESFFKSGNNESGERETITDNAPDDESRTNDGAESAAI